MNKAQLIKEYVTRTIDGMDIEMMEDFLSSYLTSHFSSYSYAELVEEVKEFYPEILEAN